MIGSGILYSLLFTYVGLLLLATRGITTHTASQRWQQHPTIIIVALGIYANATGLAISFDLAYKYGFGFLGFYLGTTGMFLLAPVMLYPLFKIAARHQLFSVPDLLAFRYRSQMAGTLSAIVSLVGVIIVLAVQVKIFAHTVELITSRPLSPSGAGIFIGLAVLIVLLIDRQSAADQDNSPLICLLSIQSAIKIVLMLGLGLFLVYTQFGGFQDLDRWIEENGQRISAMDRHLGEDPWRAMLLLFFSAALIFPPMFHLLFSENRRSNTLFKASWGFPLYLLLFSLPVPIILWSAIKMSTPADPELYFVGISLSLNSPLWGGITAVASIVSGVLMLALSSLSLAGLSLNHLILPFKQPGSGNDIYRWLNSYKRVVVFLVIASPWLLFLYLPEGIGSSDLVIIGLSLLAQLLPGILSLVFWPQGNRRGMLTGLCAGCLVWCTALYLPAIHQIDLFHLLDIIKVPFYHDKDWHDYLLLSLTLNTSLFVLLSLVTKTSRDEAAIAHACSVDTLLEARQQDFATLTAEELINRLSRALGPRAAAKEVNQALDALSLPLNEKRPLALKRLRKQLDVNLSGLLGPTMARSIIRRFLDTHKPELQQSSDIHLVESRLDDYHTRLSGLAAELDQLRRFHRQILMQLPVAACSVGENREVLMWNLAMEQLTSVNEDEIIGGHFAMLPEPWSGLLIQFSAEPASHIPKRRFLVNGQPRWFSLHKSTFDPGGESGKGLVVLIEDTTETQMLEEELIHSERLASVGRLAAGVAHEIGNPITGIACLSQNLKLMTNNQEVLDTSKQILDQTQRISRILQTLMNFSRRGNHSNQALWEKVSLWHCVDEAIHLLKLSPEASQIHFLNLVAKEASAVGDAQRLVQVFVNLLTNAKDASPIDTTIRVESELKSQLIEIRVIDEGCGIRDSEKDRLFEPFYTTKGPDKGTGLGLALVYGIIEEHFGHIRVESPAPETGKGTQVTIALPLQTTDKTG